MKFIKDLLFIETTTTGPDTDKDSIIQLSAILLDKDNLLEKSYFNSYVRVSLLDNCIQKHAELLGTSPITLQKSPKIYETIKSFHTTYNSELILATHNIQNILFLKNAYKKTAIVWPFDVHILELWTLSYIYSLHYGIRKIPTLYTLLDHFRLKLKNPSDALERVRNQTIIFKKLIIHT